LKQARDLNPVLLMLDLRLPDGDGRDLLPMLRRIPGCENAPAMAVTAESGVQLSGTGFEELWAKPLDLKVVLNKLDSLADAVQSTDRTISPSPVHQSAGWFPQAPLAHLAQAAHPRF